jgi:hydroxyacylglutathione hydrolase
MEIVQLPVLQDNYVFLLHDPVSSETLVVDPAVSEPVLDLLNTRGWQLTHLLNTHFHGDHVGGNRALKAATACRIFGKSVAGEPIPDLDIELREGDTIPFGGLSIQVIEIPGHTQGHLGFWLEEENLFFCGDTLFGMGCGRLLRGTAEQLWASLQRIRALPRKTMIYCAHEYTLSNGRFAEFVDPGNSVLDRRLEQVQSLRESGLPTVPFRLEEELLTNPFLRVEDAAIQQSVGMQGQSEVDVFRALRALKDGFSA